QSIRIVGRRKTLGKRVTTILTCRRVQRYERDIAESLQLAQEMEIPNLTSRKSGITRQEQRAKHNSISRRGTFDRQGTIRCIINPPHFRRYVRVAFAAPSP